MSTKFVVPTEFSRTYPDPIQGIKHYTILARAIDLPEGIPLDPNPRKQNIDLSVYRDVQDSLENGSDPTFHLKNKGITIIATSIKQSDSKSVLTMELEDGDGIVDGGHTYQIIMDSKSNGACPDNQYVRIEIMTGLGINDVVDIARGLNTAVQVQESTLANLDGKFDWIKAELDNTCYADKIAYKQNERNEFDIREIISIMTAFVCPNPKISYSSKSACLSYYLENQKAYEQLCPILCDILYLYDHIQIHAKDQYNLNKRNNGGIGRAGAMTGLFEKKERGKLFQFIFAGVESEYRMHSGVLYPIIGAMKCLIEIKPGQSKYSWVFDGFEEVKEFFNKNAAYIVETTYETCRKYGGKPNALGKDITHWKSLSNFIGSVFWKEKAIR